MKKVYYALSLIFVAAASSAITYVVVNERAIKKAENIVNESMKELDSFKIPEYAPNTINNPDGTVKVTVTEWESNEYSDIVTNGYSTPVPETIETKDFETSKFIDHVIENATQTEPSNVFDIPQVIPPDEYGENPDFDMTTLALYTDGILADEWFEVIDLDVIGKDSINHFGEFEKDTIYIKDNKTQCYYEVYKESTTYQEAVDDYNHHIEAQIEVREDEEDY